MVGDPWYRFRVRLGGRLRLWRLRRGLTLEAVGRRSGVGAAYVSRMERGERPIPLDWILRAGVPLALFAHVVRPRKRGGFIMYNEQDWLWVDEAIGADYQWRAGSLRSKWAEIRRACDCSGFVCGGYAEAARRGLVELRTVLADIGSDAWKDASTPITDVAEVRAGDLILSRHRHVEWVRSVAVMGDGKRRVMAIGAHGGGEENGPGAATVFGCVDVHPAARVYGYAGFMRPKRSLLVFADGREQGA